MQATKEQVEEVVQRTGLNKQEVLRAFERVVSPDDIYTFLKFRGSDVMDHNFGPISEVK